MIKIFRRIRHKLLVEGKFKKYLQYGLGEIFLVVIGILIAVQINNVNIRWQNEEKEILYLTRLTTNLGYDVRLYKSIISKDSLLINNLNDAVKDIPAFIETVNHPIKDLNFLIAGYKFSANRTVIDNLISSGQIELLRSNYLVEDIFRYYRTTGHTASVIDATLLANNQEIINNLILKFNSKSKTDSNYLNTLDNSLHFRIQLIEKQRKRYNDQKNV